MLDDFRDQFNPPKSKFQAVVNFRKVTVTPTMTPFPSPDPPPTPTISHSPINLYRLPMSGGFGDGNLHFQGQQVTFKESHLQSTSAG